MSVAAIDLDAVVRALPGVTGLYSTAPVVVRSVREIAVRSEPLVSISGPTDAPIISVSVGVDSSAGAPATAASIARAIHAALPPGVRAEVSVRVSRVIAT